MLKRWMTLCTLLAGAGSLTSQQTMTIEEYQPKSTLVVPQHPVSKAKYPFVDIHSHQPQVPSADRVDSLVKEMDSINLRVIINLTGGTGDVLARGGKAYQGRYPDRF